MTSRQQYVKRQKGIRRQRLTPRLTLTIYGNLKDEGALYSATVDNTDRAIGRLVAKLKETCKLDNMRTDPDETTNLIEKHPEVVSELTALAGEYVRKERSTPGPRQKTSLQIWPQLDWLPKKPTNFRSEKP